MSFCSVFATKCEDTWSKKHQNQKHKHFITETFPSNIPETEAEKIFFTLVNQILKWGRVRRPAWTCPAAGKRVAMATACSKKYVLIETKMMFSVDMMNFVFHIYCFPLKAEWLCIFQQTSVSLWTCSPNLVSVSWSKLDLRAFMWNESIHLKLIWLLWNFTSLFPHILHENTIISKQTDRFL